MPKRPDHRHQSARSSSAPTPLMRPERLAALTAMIPDVAAALRAADGRDALIDALRSFAELPTGEQQALALALGQQRDALGEQSADVAEAIAELSEDRAAAKEARRSVIRLRSAGARPSISVPRAAAVLSGEAAVTSVTPQFVDAWASRTRERSEVKLAIIWTRPTSQVDIDGYFLSLNFWEGRIEGVRHVEPMTQKRFEREVLDTARTEDHFSWVHVTEAQTRALIDDVLDQQTWREEPATPEWAEVESIVLRRLAEVTPDFAVTRRLLDGEPGEEETLVNFWGSWCFGDYGLAYELLSDRHLIRERETREAFIALRRQWYAEAHPARFQIGAVVQQAQEQSGIWLPGTSAVSQNRKNLMLFWSAELQETPITGQMSEMPLATIVNPDTGRHWFWQTVTMERDPNQGVWVVGRIRDDGLTAQSQPIDDLLKRSDERWKEAEQVAEQTYDTEEAARNQSLNVLSLANEALSLGETALMRLPTDRSLHEKLHDEAAQIGLWDRAAAITHRMLTHFTDKPRFLRDLSALDFRKASSLAEAGDEVGSVRWLRLAQDAGREAVELDRTPESLVILAELLLSSGELEEAESLLRESIAIQETTGAWADLGDILMRQGKQRDAVSAFERAQHLEPQSPEIRWRLGRALELAERPTEARLVYEDALATDENDAMAHGLLGNLLIEQQDFDTAELHLERALQLGLLSAQLLTQLAYIASQKQQFDKAQGLLAQAAQLDPSLANDVKHLLTNLRAEEEKLKRSKR